MTREEKKTIDILIRNAFCLIFSPVLVIYFITYGISKGLEWLFVKALNPLYYKICILVRKPIPNSTVHVKGKDNNHFKRVNEKLLTIKEAKVIGKQYEDDGYIVQLHLSEF